MQRFFDRFLMSEFFNSHACSHRPSHHEIAATSTPQT